MLVNFEEGMKGVISPEKASSSIRVKIRPNWMDPLLPSSQFSGHSDTRRERNTPSLAFLRPVLYPITSSPFLKLLFTMFGFFVWSIRYVNCAFTCFRTEH